MKELKGGKCNMMKTKYSATKGKKKLLNLSEFDARHYASVGGWEVKGFTKAKKQVKKLLK